MAGTVTDTGLTLPLTSQTQQPTASGQITGTGVPGLDGKYVVYVVMVDKTNPGKPVDPARDATLASVLGAVARGAKTLTTTVVGTTATPILAANTGRKAAVILNAPSSAVTLYIGPSGVTTSAYMWALAPGQGWLDKESSDAWYGVCATGSVTAAVTETA